MSASRRLAVVGVCLALAAGCGDNLKPAGQADGGGSVVPQADAAVPGVPVLKFADGPEAVAQGKYRTAFRLHETRSILAVASLPDATGPRVMRLEVYNQSGAVVRTLYRAFATDASVGTEVSHPLSGTPLRVERAQVVSGTARVELGIPLAGTSLARFGVKGNFKARAFLEAPDPFATGAFELRGDQ